MPTNDYTYGQGIFNTDDARFITPKILTQAEYQITVSLDMDKQQYKANKLYRSDRLINRIFYAF